jgi:hypothetical protein
MGFAIVAILNNLVLTHSPWTQISILEEHTATLTLLNGGEIAMAPNLAILRAVETLDYRVTVGDVSSQAGLDIKLAERDLLALASEAGAHLQVAESGEIAYLFPRNFRTILRNKHWQLQLQESWDKIWGVVFYGIRISFGILLIASIVLISIAIVAILIAISASNQGDNRGGGNRGNFGGGFYMPWFWISSDWFWYLSPNYNRRSQSRKRQKTRPGSDSEMNFLEAIFSFLFGDGNPNANLEERRWQAIATTIRNDQGAVIAEQVAPYLDQVDDSQQENEDYILPVLSRFNGRPEVSPEGQIIYHFPELQATTTQRQTQPVAAYLREMPWQFSQASSGQKIGAIGLGSVNLVAALMLRSLLGDGTIAAQLGGLVAFVAGIYWILLGYGIGFLVIPLIRYFWVQWRNQKIASRNQQRQARADRLNQAGEAMQRKIAFARQFAATHVIGESNLAYTTETDLTTQELQQADKIDEEWRRRIEQGEG